MLHCHHRNEVCIKIGSDESRFNVSVIPRNKVTRQCPKTTTCEGQSHKTVHRPQLLKREGRAEAESNRGRSAYQRNVLPPAQPAD